MSHILIAVVTAIIGMVALSSSLIGYLSDRCAVWERMALTAAGLMMIKPGLVTDIAGVALFAAVLLWQMKRKKA